MMRKPQSLMLTKLAVTIMINTWKAKFQEITIVVEYAYIIIYVRIKSHRLVYIYSREVEG